MWKEDMKVVKKSIEHTSSVLSTMDNSMDPVAQSSPSSQSAPNVALKDKVRGRGKIWDEKETSAKKNCYQNANFIQTSFTSYESKVKWLKTKFHIINDMLKQSGFQWNDVEKKVACERDSYDNYCKATGGVAEGFGDAIRNIEFQQNVESRGENLGDYHVSLSDDEGNDVEFMSKETQSASNISNA
ncbi:hypothetical protein Tco_0038891 [Tanacetum coccineum]